MWPRGKQKIRFLPRLPPQPNSLGGTWQGVPWGDTMLLVAGCLWQPFRSAGFPWTGKALRFLPADIPLSALVQVMCRQELRAEPRLFAMTIWGMRCWQELG